MSDYISLRLDLDALAADERLPENVRASCEEASEAIEELEDFLDAVGELESLEADENFAEFLYQAIVERRTDDAVELMRKMFSINFMEPKNYANLFPERIK